MTPKEALKKLNNFISREKHIDSERNKTINKCVDTITQALDRFEQLEKENQNWKEKATSFRKGNIGYCKKVIELENQIKKLEKENQELQAKVYELDTVKLAIQNGLFKATIQENEKYKKVITWLKNTFEITLDSKVRISDEIDCIQAFPIDLKTNEVLYDLLKEVLG